MDRNWRICTRIRQSKVEGYVLGVAAYAALYLPRESLIYENKAATGGVIMTITSKMIG